MSHYEIKRSMQEFLGQLFHPLISFITFYQLFAFWVVHGKSCVKAEKGNVVEEKKAEAAEACGPQLEHRYGKKHEKQVTECAYKIRRFIIIPTPMNSYKKIQKHKWSMIEPESTRNGPAVDGDNTVHGSTW